MTKFKLGEYALYCGAWGANPAQRCVIIGEGEKNGRLVYDCRLDNGAKHWGYVDQFKPLESRTMRFGASGWSV